MAITVNDPELQLTQADNQFIKLINNRVTMYGRIPYTVPQELIIDIIILSARRFYRAYWRAGERAFYRISKNDILSFLKDNDQIQTFEDQRIGYTLTLPSYIRLVYDIYEINAKRVTTSQQLIENVQLLQRSAPYGQSIMGINNTLYIMEACCKLIEEQNYDSIFGTSVPFRYNQNTFKIHIAKTIDRDLVLETEKNIDIQILYNDELFIRYVLAKTKEELKRLIDSHVLPLPGEVTLNVDSICNNIEDYTVVEEILKNSGGIGDIIMYR